jgi:hypothetical protein
MTDQGIANKKWVMWVGRVLSAIPALMLTLSGVMKLTHGQEIVAMWTDKFGFPPGALTPIGVLELACMILYVIPQTAVLGAILVSCYLAAAACVHIRIGDASAVSPVVLGIFAWLGLYLRDARLRELIPLRRARG